MSFETDKQTLDDLNLLGKYKNNSVYSMFVGTVTRGGDRMMENMFLHPLTDAKAINDRSSVFRYFRDHDFGFPFEKDEFDVVEQYITGASSKHGFRNIFQLLKAKSMHYISNDPEFNIIRERILMSIKFYRKAREYFDKLATDVAGNPFQSVVEKGRSLLKDSRIDKLLGHPRQDNPGLVNLIAFDRVFRCLLNKQFKEVIELLQGVDLNVVVGKVAKEKNFCFATAADDGEVLVAATGLHHPRIDGAISNDLEVTKSKNIFFLTGANMAGKSTYMKAFGVAVYLAHCGFPVPASRMELSPFRGLFTTINLSDNLSLGYSHYYNEVARVKYVVEQVRDLEDVVVVFDELFRGTNVKDAFDASRAVVGALARLKQGVFMISSHIVEVAGTLEKEDSVDFRFFDIRMENDEPRYTYHLREGVSEERIGMYILRKAGVVDLIESLK